MSLRNVRACESLGSCRRAGSAAAWRLAIVALAGGASQAASTADVLVVLASDGRSCAVAAPSSLPADASLKILHRMATWSEACRAAASEPRCPMHSSDSVTACGESGRHPLPRRVLAIRPGAAPLDGDRLLRGQLANIYGDVSQRLAVMKAGAGIGAKEVQRRLSSASDVLMRDSSLGLLARVQGAWLALIDSGESDRSPHEATVESFPAAMNLWAGGVPDCGATVIGDRKLLTAAHCVGGDMKVTVERRCPNEPAELQEATCRLHKSFDICGTQVCAFDLAVCETTNPIMCTGQSAARLAADAPSAETPLFLFGHLLGGAFATYRIAPPDPIAPVGSDACASDTIPKESILKIGQENGKPYLPHLSKRDSGHAMYGDKDSTPDGLLIVGINVGFRGYASFGAQASCGYVREFVNGP